MRFRITGPAPRVSACGTPTDGSSAPVSGPPGAASVIARTSSRGAAQCRACSGSCPCAPSQATAWTRPGGTRPARAAEAFLTEPALDAIDFPNSFLTFNRLDQNIARIQLDARCQYAPRKDAPAREYFLITPCKSERMYVREDLWQDPNHDYRGFYSETEHMTLKIYPSADRDRRYAQLNSERFAAIELAIRRAPRSRRLGTDSEIREAVIAGEKLVARHKIIDEATGGWAVLEYPVKTI